MRIVTLPGGHDCAREKVTNGERNPRGLPLRARYVVTGNPVIGTRMHGGRGGSVHGYRG